MNKIIAKQISSTSYILSTDNQGLNEKIGVLVQYKETLEKSGYELFVQNQESIKIQNIKELEELLDSTIEFKEIEIQESAQEIQDALLGYPVQETDTVLDVQPCLEIPGLVTFRKSERSKVRFYPGWWIVPAENNSNSYAGTGIVPRISISTSTYKKYKDTIKGPYKTFMEVTFNIKK